MFTVKERRNLEIILFALLDLELTFRISFFRKIINKNT